MYTNSYTNTESIKQLLEPKTDFEWGFRYNTITNNDKNKEWKHRLKAMSVLVPAAKAAIAESVIKEVFEQKSASQKTRGLTNSYLFNNPEYTVKNEREAQLHSYALNGQEFHQTHTKCAVVISITQNIDSLVYTKHTKDMTLREMILSIPSQDTTWGSMSLFRSIDFVHDTSKVWIGTGFGPGGPGYIFTYIDWVEGEALEMIKGLGVYLSAYYGKSSIVRCFNRDHWEANKKWKWDKSSNKFDTPDIRHQAYNVLYDPLQSIIRARHAAHLDEKELDKDNEDNNDKQEGWDVNDLDTGSTGGKSSVSSVDPEKVYQDAMLIELSILEQENNQQLQATSNIQYPNDAESTFSDAERLRDMDFLKKQNDSDLNSCDNNNDKVKHVRNVKVTSEDMSVASSLTLDSLPPRQTSPPTTYHDHKDEEHSHNSINTNISFTSLKNMDVEHMSEDEIRKHYDQALYHKVRKAQAQKEILIAKVMDKAKHDSKHNSKSLTVPTQEHPLLPNSSTDDQFNTSTNKDSSTQSGILREILQPLADASSIHANNHSHATTSSFEKVNMVHEPSNMSKTDKVMTGQSLNANELVNSHNVDVLP